MATRRIVAAVDASDSARRAAERALSLARRLDATLTLLHVYSPGIADESGVFSSVELTAKNRRLGKKAMDVLVAQLGNPEVEAVHEVGVDVPGTICEVAAKLGADLVVAGTIGRTGVSRFFLGSVAENVMRRAHCPVWIERSSEPRLRDVERVMVCTDLSALSEAGIALASTIARDLGCSAELVYALEPAYRGLSIDARRETTEELRAKLAALAAKHFEEPMPRITTVEGANAVDGLTAHASRTSPDLLVLATHGRTGLARAFMGSVAERVARFAPCSVLVARSPVEG